MLAYVPGCWDLFHIGHLNFLHMAKSISETLIVGAASDEVVLQDKGSPPIIRISDRLAILRALRDVDVAEAYYELRFLPQLEKWKPDLLIVGGDWGSEERHLEAEAFMAEQNKRIISLPYTLRISTTKIKECIRDGRTASFV